MRGGGGEIRPYPNFSFARPIAKKPTFLRLRGSFEYEIQSWKYSIPLFFTTQGFDTFRNREISTGAGAIREQLADLDLRILIDYSLVEWKELGEEGLAGNEWEDRKIGRRKDFLVRRMELAKHFIRTNIEPEWMVLCLLPALPPGGTWTTPLLPLLPTHRAHREETNRGGIVSNGGWTVEKGGGRR